MWFCEVSQSIAPATQNEVPCPIILHAFMFNPCLTKFYFLFFFSFVWSCEASQSIAPATQNEVPCPMILHAIIFNHFLKNDEFAFFTEVRG